MIEGWPVQFLPVASPLDEEALEQAVEIDMARPEEAPLGVRCLRAEHVVAVAIALGRPNDFARIHAFLEQGAVNLEKLQSVLIRHNLMSAWKEFSARRRSTTHGHEARTMKDSMQRYPDNSEIHACKTQGRKERTRATFGEKLDALDALRARVEPIIRAREARRQRPLALGNGPKNR